MVLLQHSSHFRCSKCSSHRKENSEKFEVQSHSGLLLVHKFKHDVSGLRDHGDLIASPVLCVVIFPVGGADKVLGDGRVDLGESRGARGQVLRERGAAFFGGERQIAGERPRKVNGDRPRFGRRVELERGAASAACALVPVM